MKFGSDLRMYSAKRFRYAPLAKDKKKKVGRTKESARKQTRPRHPKGAFSYPPIAGICSAI
jgi:hypothetical protein